MTNEQPEQWAVEKSHQAWLKANADNHIEAGGYSEHAIFDMGWDAAQRAFAEREAELVADNAKLREANMRLRNGYADAVSGLVYIIQEHGRLSGVGFDRVLDNFAEWVTIPEREGLQAGSHTLAALKSREAGHG